MQDSKTVIHIITGLEDAGAEGALYRFTTQDRATRHIVVSLAGPGKYGPLLEEAGIELHCLNTTRSSFLGSFRRLTRLIKDKRPDAVQTWMYEADVFGGLAARMAGVRNLHWSIRFSTVDMKGVPSKMKWAIRASIPLARILPRTIWRKRLLSRSIFSVMGHSFVTNRLGHHLAQRCWRQNSRHLSRFRRRNRDHGLVVL